MLFPDFVGQNIERRKRYDREFQRVFGVPLANYFCNLTGFDICKFDEDFIKSKDGESCSDAVLAKFNREGLEIIKNLM